MANTRDEFDDFFDDLEKEEKEQKVSNTVKKELESEEEVKEHNANKGGKKNKGGFPVIALIGIIVVVLVIAVIIGLNMIKQSNAKKVAAEAARQQQMLEESRAKEESESLQRMLEEQQREREKEKEPETDEFGDVIETDDEEIVDEDSSSSSKKDDGKVQYDELEFSADMDGTFTVTKFKVSEKESHGEYRVENECVGSISGFGGDYILNVPYSIPVKRTYKIPVKYKIAEIDENGENIAISDLRIDYTKAFAEAEAAKQEAAQKEKK